LGEDTGAPLGGFISKDSAAIVPRGQRLTEDLTFLQLINHLDAPHERMLKRCNRFRFEVFGFLEAEEQSVLPLWGFSEVSALSG
jgi:hypothetical protein